MLYLYKDENIFGSKLISDTEFDSESNNPLANKTISNALVEQLPYIESGITPVINANLNGKIINIYFKHKFKKPPVVVIKPIYGFIALTNSVTTERFSVGASSNGGNSSIWTNSRAMWMAIGERGD